MDKYLFNFQGLDVTVMTNNNEPWFIAKDVCKLLDIKNTTVAVGRLDQDEVTKFNLGGLQGEVNLVNESGLYELIFASRKAEAKTFKKWVKQEVLPAVRKHGTYMTPQTIEEVLSNPDTIIKIATQLKEEQKKRIQAEQVIEQQKSKVIFAESVEGSQDSILIAQLAKIITQNGITIGQNRLFAWFRENGYLGRKGKQYNEPTQYSIERGLFEVKERTVNGTMLTRTTLVTGKGQVYFINKFLSKKMVI